MSTSVDGGSDQSVDWMTVFVPLAPQGKAEAVAGQIADAIRAGLVSDGQRLPAESELAQLFGVAVMTAREALEALRRRGLVTTRRGRGGGSYAVTPTEPGKEAERLLREWKVVDIRDLALHYSVIAQAAASRCAHYLSEPEVQDLTELVRGLMQRGDARKAELAIRQELAAGSRSSRLYREQTHLQSEYGPLLWLGLDDPQASAAGLTAHLEVARAISEGDADAARVAVKQSLQTALAAILARREREVRP